MSKKTLAVFFYRTGCGGNDRRGLFSQHKNHRDENLQREMGCGSFRRSGRTAYIGDGFSRTSRGIRADSCDDFRSGLQNPLFHPSENHDRWQGSRFEIPSSSTKREDRLPSDFETGRKTAVRFAFHAAMENRIPEFVRLEIYLD